MGLFDKINQALHESRYGSGDPLASLAEAIAPSVASALYSWNVGSQPIRDYYNPVLGLARNFAANPVGNLQDAYGQMAGAILPNQAEIGQSIGTAFGELRAAPFGRTGGGDARTLRQAALGDAGDLAVQQKIDAVKASVAPIATAYGDLLLSPYNTIFGANTPKSAPPMPTFPQPYVKKVATARQAPASVVRYPRLSTGVAVR